MRSESGMTLLEVLVALAILALTGLLLSEGVLLGTNLRERSEIEVQAAVQRIEAARILRGLIEQAEPIAPGEALEPFRGDAHGMTFVTYAAAGLAGGSGRQIRLYHDADHAELRLQVSDPTASAGEPANPDDRPEAESDLLLLADSPSVSLRYFGFDETLQATAWTDQWRERADLPLLVEIVIEAPEGRDPLVARVVPRLRWPVVCLLRASRACRAGFR